MPDVLSTIPKPAERTAWLEARAPYVGASEAACLLGLHPFKSLAELAAEKLYGTAQPENRAMMRGRRLEAAVAEWYSAELGLALEEPEVLYLDGTGSLCATLDRRVVGTLVGVEIKTTGHYVREPEAYWVIQAQAQMLCAGLERVELAVLDASLDLEVYPVLPDRPLQRELQARARDFLGWIRAGEMPPDLPLDYPTARALYPVADPEAEPVELDAEALSWVRSLRTVSERIKGLETEASTLRGMVARVLGNATEGVHEGARVVTWRPVARPSVDLKRLRRDHPEIVAEYVTTSSSRTLRLS